MHKMMMTSPTGGHATWPAFARIPMACHLSGLSRSGLYRELTAGRIRAVKHANATLIDMASVRSFLDSLPEATIRVADASPRADIRTAA